MTFIALLTTIVTVLVTSALFGWGLQLVWNKFAPLAWKEAPTITWVEGFAAYLLLALLAGAGQIFGA